MALKRKSYKITCSLEEGYESDSRLHTRCEVAKIIGNWLTERLQTNQSIITGLLQEGTLFFPSKASDNELVTVSPTIIYTGELSSAEDLKREDTEVKRSLEALAKALKESLRQESVFIVYQDENWCV
ncbi:hypothetical protein [Mucilaginibacter antarcticus]|uniref:Uncharacterized protein n=1 Tax=Mucilaginibacter antarcticus TaxID=1855725 RepID=A0ABW5XT93_9SPHI